MARNQRRRKSGKRSRRQSTPTRESSGGGGLSSMRSGFQNMVGGSGPRRAPDPGAKFLRLMGILIVVGAIVWALAR